MNSIIPSCPVVLGQELEVFYPDLGVPHRGIVYQIFWKVAEWKWDISVVHNSKGGGGVGITSIEQFGQGNLVNILWSPESLEHLQIIFERANLALRVGVKYFVLNGNCQHFTTWCYTGEPQSPTLQVSVAVVGFAFFVGAIIDDSTKRKSRERHGHVTRS